MDVLWLVLLVFNLYLMAPLTLFYAMINCGNKTHTEFVFISSVNLWIAECCCDQSYIQFSKLVSSILLLFFTSFGSFSNPIQSSIAMEREIGKSSSFGGSPRSWPIGTHLRATVKQPEEKKSVKDFISTDEQRAMNEIYLWNAEEVFSVVFVSLDPRTRRFPFLSGGWRKE